MIFLDLDNFPFKPNMPILVPVESSIISEKYYSKHDCTEVYIYSPPHKQFVRLTVRDKNLTPYYFIL